MANTAISTNTKLSDDLTLTGKPVLVQNNLGIFYGFLEKSDSRTASALLRDGFRLSPDRHITFTQYLDFFLGEFNKMREQAWSSVKDNQELSGELLRSVYKTKPDQLVIDEATFDEHKRDLSITDYASEGIFLVQRRTSSHTSSSYMQATTPLVSLTNVSAIVSVSNLAIVHPATHDVDPSLSSDWLHGEDATISWDMISPMITFLLVGSDLMRIRQWNQTDYVQELMEEGVVKEFETYLGVSRSFKYIMEELDMLTKNENGTYGALDYADTVLNTLPSLVVNSNQRVKLFEQKARDYEQDK